MNRSTRARVLAFEGVRELGTKQVGFTVFATNEGDANSADYSKLALENLDQVDSDQAMQDSMWQREIARRLASETGVAREINLTAQEWEEVPGEYESWSAPSEEEIEADEDGEIVEFDDVVGEPIYTDKWSTIGEAIDVLENHALITEFGFRFTDLITPEENPMQIEYLAVVITGCRAASELAKMVGYGQVCGIVGVKNVGQPIKAFGVERLFRAVGKLQARIEQIRAEEDRRVAEVVRRKAEARVAEESRKANLVKPAIALPARSTARRSMQKATELTKPDGSDDLGRVTTPAGLAFKCVCGCGGMVLEKVAVVPHRKVVDERQEGENVSWKELWRHAFAPNCIRRFGEGFSLVDARKRVYDEETRRNAAQR